jgi:hypothetical protein
MKRSTINAALAVSCIAWLGAGAWSVIPKDYLFKTVDEYRRVDSSVNDRGQQAILQPNSYNNPAITLGFLAMAIASGVCLASNLEDKPVNEVEKPVSRSQPNQQVATPIVIKNNVRATAISRPNPAQSAQAKKSFTPETIFEEADPHSWRTTLHEVNCLLIYGEQGAGKTTYAEAEAREREDLGHKVYVLDPHREFGAWDGLEVIGDGMDYLAIDEKLQFVKDLVKSRYKQRASIPNFDPQPISVFCEEFTNWSDRCKNSDEFFSGSLSDFRKAKVHVVFVSHGDTLGNLTKKVGMAGNRDRGMVKLEMIGADGPNGKTIPSGTAILTRPRQQPITVSVPNLSKASGDRNAVVEPEESVDDLIAELDRIAAIGKDNVLPFARTA